MLPKHRFTAFLENLYYLELSFRRRERGIDTVIVAGTATNVVGEFHCVGCDDARLFVFSCRMTQRS